MNRARSGKLWIDFAAVSLIIFCIALIYGQVAGHQFVAWDDTSYISENPRVLEGIHWGNVVWAFSTFQLSNWHPLTLLSHMADVSIWGVHPGAYALHNVVLHGVNSILVYTFFLRIEPNSAAKLSKQLFAFVIAILFSIHPLHVESVAWISERKDLLCALFWMLAIHSYIYYVRCPSPLRYAMVTAGVALSLLAKPMAITLPIVLLLLDVGPLHRIRHWQALAVRKLCFEKLPWILMAITVGVLTIQAQNHAMPAFGILDRFRVALAAYGWYLEKTIWPEGLHFYYLTESAWNATRLWGSAAALASITWMVFHHRKQHPDWAAGWIWFVLTLVPVVGFVKVGTQAWADRYSYLPHIGLFWMMVSMGASLMNTRLQKIMASASLILFVLILTRLAERQTSTWRDTETLYRHALNQNADHYVALMGLANYSLRQQDFTRAKSFAFQALALSQGEGLVRSMRSLLGDVALKEGDISSAINQYSLGAQIDPVDEGIRTKLGLALLRVGRLREAEFALKAAIERSNDSVEAINGLGVVLAMQGLYVESISVLSKGIELAPSHRSMRYNFAIAARRSGNIGLARQTYNEILERYPEDDVARKGLSDVSELSN